MLLIQSLFSPICVLSARAVSPFRQLDYYNIICLTNPSIGGNGTPTSPSECLCFLLVPDICEFCFWQVSLLRLKVCVKLKFYSIIITKLHHLVKKYFSVLIKFYLSICFKIVQCVADSSSPAHIIHNMSSSTGCK